MGEVYRLRDFMICRSEGVIYLATCSCPPDYVGKTCREFKKRIREHLSNIRREINTPFSHHIRDKHEGQVDALTFRGIKFVEPPLRGW